MIRTFATGVVLQQWTVALDNWFSPLLEIAYVELS